MLARKIAQADLDLDLPICDMPTWDSLPQRHRISAVPGKRGERWAADRRPRTPLEVGPSFVLFPGGRIVVHRQWAPHSATRMVRIESELGKGRAGWQLAGLAGWLGGGNRFWCPRAIARDWRGFCKIRFPGQLGAVWAPRRRPKPPRRCWLRVFASSSGCLSFLVLGLSGPVCPYLQPAQPSFVLCYACCPDPIPPII